MAVDDIYGLKGISDSLVYIDEDVTDWQRDEVNNMILQELARMNIQEPHLSLENRFLPNDRDDVALLKEIYLREEQEELVLDDTTFSIGGVDMSKYTNLTTEENEINYENLYLSLSHSILRKRSLTLASVTNDVNKNKWLITNDNLAQYNQSLEEEVMKKRKAVDEINVSRKKQQMDFKPTNDVLETSWQDAVKECIDIGVECASLELSR